MEVEETADTTFLVYPNPTNGLLVVLSKNAREYRITNLLGQTVKLGSITAEPQQIDIHGLTEGMYFITVGEQTQKIIVNP